MLKHVNGRLFLEHGVLLFILAIKRHCDYFFRITSKVSSVFLASLHRVRKKSATLLLPLTLPNANRFSRTLSPVGLAVNL